MGLNQWKSTHQVLNWFSGIKYKSRKKFLQFDICEFCPLITEDLYIAQGPRIRQPRRVCKTYVDATQENINIILHCRKTFLFAAPPDSKHPTPWEKKSGAFDVTMGAYDGAEVCELVGLYLPYTFCL